MSKTTKQQSDTEFDTDGGEVMGCVVGGVGIPTVIDGGGMTPVVGLDGEGVEGLAKTEVVTEVRGVV